MPIMTVMRLVLVLFLGLASVALGEIRTFAGIIEAASGFIHFSEGYIIAPGFIDISQLVFQTIGEPDDYVPNEEFPDDQPPPDDDRESFVDDDVTEDYPSGDSGEHSETGNGDGGSGGGGGRQLADGGDASSPGTTVDIVFFHEPKECSNSRSGCDWTKLGVGTSDGEGGLRWCCSNDAVDFGFCDGGSQYGRLIVNSTLFKGQHRFINVPAHGKLETTVRYGKMEEPTESGKYVLVIANCNDEGRDVIVDGKYTWKSKHGYLPGDLFTEMYFFVFLTIVYLILLLWYGFSMRMYEDATIQIQKWILGTIAMGLLEAFFRTGDYFVWNEDGTRFWFAMYTGLIVGVLKRGISRCLIVMVSLGWGVTRESLSSIKTIVVLGVLYVGTSAARDIMTLFAVTENQTLSINEEEELFDVVTILTFVVAAIDVTFYLWILDALNGTMQYLENMSQASKLRRYLRLRCILLLSILFAVIWSVFGIVSTAMEDAMLEERQEWAVSAAMEINYLFVLIGVAVLWRPNPNAKEYAYVMELPGISGDGENELEMTENVPSALDDDEEDGEEGVFANGNGAGYRDSDEEGLPVEDAVAT